MAQENADLHQSGSGETPSELDTADLAKQVRELEAKLIEQDHRWVSVFVNLYTAFHRYARDDPRRSAAFRAVAWRIFSPSTAVAGAIGIVSILGLLVAMHANYLLALQNQRIDQQTLLLEAQRRAGLVTEFTAVVEQIERERTTHGSSKHERSGLLRLSPPTIGRIVALSRSYRPYLYLEISGEADETLTGIVATQQMASVEMPKWLQVVNRSLGLELRSEGERPRMTKVSLSPERGQLLIALVSAQIDLAPIAAQFADFSRSDLRRAVLTSINLSNFNLTRSSFVAADLMGANLETAFLAGADFSRACLSNSKLDGTTLQSASLVDAKLDGATIPEPEQLSGADMHDTDLSGLIVSRGTWLDDLIKQKDPPVGFERAQWRIETIPSASAGAPGDDRHRTGAPAQRFQVAPTGPRPRSKSIC